MRIYESATIQDEQVTGFQSPAHEFAAKPLSFDEKYGVGNPALKLLTVQSDFPKLGVFKGDQLLVDLSKKAGAKSLVVTFLNDEVKLFKGTPENIFEDVVCGVVSVIIRSQY